MRTSCIQHPESDRYLIVRAWQIAACDGNDCAAMLLSFFEYSHNWKLENAEKMRELNDLAERMKLPRIHSESTVQWHNDEELRAGILYRYSEHPIRTALALLEAKGFVLPAPHHFIRANGLPDRTRHFSFQPDAINAWLRAHSAEIRDGTFPIPQKCGTSGAEVRNMSRRSAALTYKYNQRKQSKRENARAQNLEVETETQNEAEKQPPDPATTSHAPFVEGESDPRFQTPHFLAVCRACGFNPKNVSWKKAAQIAVAATRLADYSPEQIDLARGAWNRPTPPHPDQIADEIDRLLAIAENTHEHSQPLSRRQQTVAQLRRDFSGVVGDCDPFGGGLSDFGIPKNDDGGDESGREFVVAASFPNST